MTTPGEQVGAAVDSAVQNANDTAATEIAVARENADAAARNAQQIADAALQSELGQRIEGTRRDFETWRTDADRRLTETAEATRASQAQLAETTTLLGSIRALLTPQQPVRQEAQTPAQNQGTGQTGANSGGTEQSVPPGARAEQHPAPPARKRTYL